MVEFGVAIFNPSSTFWTMDSSEYFGMFISSPVEPLIWTFVGLALAYICVRKNMAGGIEKACKWMIPTLVVLMIIVAIRACTLPGASEGIKFMFQPSTENVMTSGGWLTVFGIALAQMFFSLNVGFGTNLMYGSYAPDDSDLAKNALLVPLRRHGRGSAGRSGHHPRRLRLRLFPRYRRRHAVHHHEGRLREHARRRHFRLHVLRGRVLCRHQLRDRYDRCQRRHPRASAGAGSNKKGTLLALACQLRSSPSPCPWATAPSAACVCWAGWARTPTSWTPSTTCARTASPLWQPWLCASSLAGSGSPLPLSRR